jgi:hypothetical protein
MDSDGYSDKLQQSELRNHRSMELSLEFDQLSDDDDHNQFRNPSGPDDSFFESNVINYNTHFDFCIVFPTELGDFTARGKGYLEKLQQLGFQLLAFRGRSQSTDKIYVMVKARMANLRAFADERDLYMLLDSKEVKNQLEAGDAQAGIAPVTIPHRPEYSSYLPYDYIYGKYSRKIDEKLYWKADDEDHPFREIIRLKLAAILLETRMNKSENLKIRRYLRNGWLKGVYPLKSKEKVKEIDDLMREYPFKPLPTDHLKEYFGEKVALFFVFIQHYSRWLRAPAIVGLAFQIAVFVLNDINANFLPFFSVFLALWAVTMLEASCRSHCHHD